MDFSRARERSWQLGDRARGHASAPSLAPPPPGRANHVGTVEFLAANPAASDIDFPPSVQTAIEQEVLAAIWRFDRRDVESAGWLFGLYAATDEGVRIAHASGPGESSKHSAGQVALARPEEIRAGFPDFLQRSQLVLVGDWHSHPGRDPEPSEADLKAWATHSGLTASAPWASLIVVPGAEMGWSVPELHGFVSYELDGRLACERAKVVPTV